MELGIARDQQAAAQVIGEVPTDGARPPTLHDRLLSVSDDHQICTDLARAGGDRPNWLAGHDPPRSGNVSFFQARKSSFKHLVISLNRLRESIARFREEEAGAFGDDGEEEYLCLTDLREKGDFPDRCPVFR